MDDIVHFVEQIAMIILSFISFQWIVLLSFCFLVAYSVLTYLVWRPWGFLEIKARSALLPVKVIKSSSKYVNQMLGMKRKWSKSWIANNTPGEMLNTLAPWHRSDNQAAACLTPLHWLGACKQGRSSKFYILILIPNPRSHDQAVAGLTPPHWLTRVSNRSLEKSHHF